jgi:hypothetical protein
MPSSSSRSTMSPTHGRKAGDFLCNLTV